jgi:hypothetical protein
MSVMARREKIPPREAFVRQFNVGGLTERSEPQKPVNPALQQQETAASQEPPNAQEDGEERVPEAADLLDEPRRGDYLAARQPDGLAPQTEVEQRTTSSNGVRDLPDAPLDNLTTVQGSPWQANEKTSVHQPEQLPSAPTQRIARDEAHEAQADPRSQDSVEPQDMEMGDSDHFARTRQDIDMDSEQDEAGETDGDIEMSDVIPGLPAAQDDVGAQAGSDDEDQAGAPRKRKRARTSKPESWKDTQRKGPVARYGLRRERTLSRKARGA